MPQSLSVLLRSVDQVALNAVIIFVTAHFVLLLGAGTPERFYFDKVHYVPTARQMLEPATAFVETSACRDRQADDSL